LTNRWINFARTNFLAAENQGPSGITVERIGDTNGTVSVDYFLNPGTATAGVDYLDQFGTLHFAPGETTQVISLSIIDDAIVEPDETISLRLKSPSANTMLGPRAIASLRILDEQRPGSVDLSFEPRGTLPGGPAVNGLYFSRPIIVQPDSKIWIGGSYNMGIPAGARLNSDGSLDGTFDLPIEPYASPKPVGVQSDGGVILWTFDLERDEPVLQKLKPDGAFDPAFHDFSSDGGWYPDSYRLTGAIQSDDKIILVSPVSSGPQELIRLTAQGESDSAFHRVSISTTNADAISEIRTITFSANGQILVGGNFSAIGNIPRHGVARLLSNGELDTNFNARLDINSALASVAPYLGWMTNVDVRSLLPQSDGKVLAAGQFSIRNDPSRNNFARFNHDGSLDLAFRPRTVATNEARTSALLQNDGKILLASVQGDQTSILTRFNPDGAPDESFAPVSFDYEIQQMALQTDGKLLLAGGFGEINGVKRTRLARLNLLPPLEFSSPSSRSGGPLHFTLTVDPGQSYVIESSFNLLDWSPFSTNSTPAFALELTDANIEFPRRFYRARVH
jgi:uncharacterized delta-60 repeat protein